MPRSLVLVSEPEYVRAQALFDSFTALRCEPGPPEDEELAAEIRNRGARHVILGPFSYPSAIYRALPRGSVVARFGVGYDGVNLGAATEAGLLCTNTPDVLHQSVAELTMLLIAAAARRLVPTASAMREGHWSPSTGAELAGGTLAVIGAGKIGAALARIASAGFQMRVIGYRRSGSSARADDDAYHSITTNFTEAVRDADYVSLHIPGVPENRHFLDARRLEQLRSDAWLINTARGAVVDEVALYQALVRHRLGGAALDVFDREPYEPADPAHDFRSLANVILLPHVGSNTAAANRRMAERALGNILKAEAGEFAAMDLLNREVLSA